MKLKNKYSKQIIYNNQKFENQIWYNQQIMTFLNFSQLPESVFCPKKISFFIPFIYIDGLRPKKPAKKK
jgi:hypothetical protein